MTSVVSDATALIVLTKLDRLALLGLLFREVLVPATVFQEVAAKPDHDPAPLHPYPFVIVPDPADSVQDKLEWVLDRGESAALALAKRRGCAVLMDEKKGRALARALGIPVIGLVGVLLALQRKREIDAGGVLDVLDRARAVGFRLSEGLMREVRDQLDPG